MKAFVRLVLVLGITATLAIGAYWSVESGWGRLEPIELVLADESDQSWLFARVQNSLKKDLKAYEGQWLWKVSLREILNKVGRDRRVRTARVTRIFPNRLRVSIEPHRPILAWVDDWGKFFPVASDASLLPSLPATEAGDVPLLRGKSFQNDEMLREKAIILMSELPSEGVFSRQRIAEISFSEKDGFLLTLTHGGVQVQLGEGDLSTKIKRVQRVLNYLSDQQLNGRVIDARFVKKVVVRLRNDP